MKIFMVAILLALTHTVVLAETVTMTVTEAATQGGNLARTCFYYCVCKQASICTCQDWKQAGTPHCVESDDGIGGDNLSHTFNLQIYEGDLPLTMRYTSTSVGTNGNETAKGAVVQTHTFTAP